ncbi:ABC transporter ATP-binding protein, partial [Amycolatopsis sp. NPDC000746]
AAVLSAPPAVPDGTAGLPAPVRGTVTFSSVSHGKLREFTLTVPPGELLGIVTADPATATDLLDCLGRFADPSTGSVRIDAADLSTVDPDRLRDVVLVAAHDADLFEGTVEDNVRGGMPAIPDGVLTASAADEVAATLPSGTATTITERGRSLSGGQRQRVALARALAAEATVLVLHDPTTAVDTVTEARIATGVADLRRTRTTIVITTSPALLAATDRVALIEDGRVVAEGSHAELVRTEATYRAAVLS